MKIREGTPIGGDKWVAASFFLDGHEKRTLAELMAQAAIADIRHATYGGGDASWFGRWRGIYVNGQLLELRRHHVLRLQFYYSDFLQLTPEEPIDVPLDRDPALPFALAFRDSCEALHPRAAILYTSPATTYVLEEKVEPQLNVDDVQRVITRGLVIAMLYVDETLAPGVYVDVMEEADSLPVTRGKLVFRGVGAGRWP